MKDLVSIISDLETYPALMWEAEEAVNQTREEMAQAKLAHEMTFSRVFLAAKTQGSGNEEAKQVALVNKDVHESAMLLIASESKWRKAQAVLNKLDNEFTAVRKEAELLKKGA